MEVFAWPPYTNSHLVDDRNNRDTTESMHLWSLYLNTEKKKFSNASAKYVSVWVEDADGKNERCLLFTEKEIARAEERSKNNSEDLTTKGFFTDLTD